MNRFPAKVFSAGWLACLTTCWLCAAGRAVDPAPFDARSFDALPLRSIGPANMSGRVVDVAVVESRPRIIYMASASGGLWKTVNNGLAWTPIFETEATVSLGAVAVAPSNPDVVWVGTGEANARNSVSWGDGLYKSTNGGKTWKHAGLADSQHIGRIVIHPTDPDVVYVAALGHLWGPNKQRGLYKTVDGGKTWALSKFSNEDTGFIDVAMDPADPDILYAAAYQVRRDAFSGGIPATGHGPGSGLFRTTDGGKTWERMTAGLPARPLGRCGLSIYRKDPRTVFAVVQTDKTPTGTAGQEGNLKEVSEDVKGKTVKHKLTADDGGIFRSDDKGKTWRQINSLVPRPFYYGQIRVDPNDVNRLYVLGVWLWVSDDGGKSFKYANAARNTHVDYHALWIDPRDSEHLVLGCDGGLNFSWDRGESWEHLKNLPLSQFYAVGVDMRKPYRVYGGLQDNGSWGGPSASRDPNGITFADWYLILGTDGFYCQIDPTDPDTVYAEGQYGNLNRIDVRSGEARKIRPRLEEKGKTKTNIKPAPPAGAPAFRFNWNSPALLSPHDAHTLYYGGNHLFRSLDRGDTWEIVSPDLTHGKPGPNVSTGHTLTTIAESPLKAGLLYAGSDDGRVHISRDGGKVWTNLDHRVGVPPDGWVTRLEASHFAEGTAYLSIDRHRNDDRRSYLFKTTDFGSAWQPLMNGLPPHGPVHVIREDPRNPRLLYAGTEFGLFISVDGGARWHRHRNGLPTVAVHDLVVHPRDQELVIATHGRGIYIMDVAPLQALTPKVLQSEAHLFEVKPAVIAGEPPSRKWFGTKMYLGSNPPQGAVVYYYLKESAAKLPLLTIADRAGKEVARLKLNERDATAGLHRVPWDLRRTPAKGGSADDQPLVEPGEYTAVLQVDALALRQRIQVNKE